MTSTARGLRAAGPVPGDVTTGASARRRRPAAPAAAGAAERADRGRAGQVLAVLNSDRFADKSVAQTWATLLDEGTYLCSMSTMHRLLRAAGQCRERRRQATHPARVKPELVATAPGQVWSWDITKLRGPPRGVYYDLYVDPRHLLPLRRRAGPSPPARTASSPRSSSPTRSRTHGAPAASHADRGTSMTSKPVAQLLVDLGVDPLPLPPARLQRQPLLRGRVQDPEVRPGVPRPVRVAGRRPRVLRASSSPTTTTSTATPAIGLHTPASVHHGTAGQIRAQRGATLDAAYAANPTRFGHRRPQPPATAHRRLDQPAHQEALIQSR